MLSMVNCAFTRHGRAAFRGSGACHALQDDSSPTTDHPTPNTCRRSPPPTPALPTASPTATVGPAKWMPPLSRTIRRSRTTEDTEARRKKNAEIWRVHSAVGPAERIRQMVLVRRWPERDPAALLDPGEENTDGVRVQLTSRSRNAAISSALLLRASVVSSAAGGGTDTGAKTRIVGWSSRPRNLGGRRRR